MPPSAYQVADWNDQSAERWVAHQARLDAMLAVFGQAAIEAAAPAATGEGNLCANGGITRMIRVSSRLVQPQLHPNRHELG